MRYLITILIIFIIHNLFAQDIQIVNKVIQTDDECFINLMERISNKDFNINVFLYNLKNYKPWQTTELGFGLKRNYYYQYSGEGVDEHSVNFITLLIFNDTICEINIGVPSRIIKSFNDNSMNKRLKSYLEQYQFKQRNKSERETTELQFFSYINNQNYRKMQKFFQQELGDIDTLIVDNEYKKEFELLTNPNHVLEYGYFCGSGGSAPDEYLAIMKFEKNNKKDILRNIIRSYQPEGRIYAIVSLLRLASDKKIKLTKLDKTLIKKILNLKIKIRTCAGCSVSLMTTKELIESFDLRKLIDENQIKL